VPLRVAQRDERHDEDDDAQRRQGDPGQTFPPLATS
jgi:hypothetical protein